jgi:hypothetical protein
MQVMPDFNTVVGALTGTAGVITLLIYLGYKGQKGEWLFKSVHDVVIARYEALILVYETRLKEKDALVAQGIAAAQAERERGDKWQQLYIESRHIIEKSTIVAASAITTAQTVSSKDVQQP